MGKIIVTFGGWAGHFLWQEREGWGEVLVPDPVPGLSVALYQTQRWGAGRSPARWSTRYCGSGT